MLRTLVMSIFSVHCLLVFKIFRYFINYDSITLLQQDHSPVEAAIMKLKLTFCCKTMHRILNHPSEMKQPKCTYCIKNTLHN